MILHGRSLLVAVPLLPLAARAAVASGTHAQVLEKVSDVLSRGGS